MQEEVLRRERKFKEAQEQLKRLQVAHDTTKS